MRRALSRGVFAGAIAAAALLAGARADPAARDVGEEDEAPLSGERVLFQADFEAWDLRVEQLPLAAFGWEQDFSTLDRPKSMGARVVETETAGGSRVLRLPAGGGSALLVSRRLPEPGLEPTHPPVRAGERLVVEAMLRWDDLGPGRWRLGVRFARERDASTGRPAFGSDEAAVHPLLAGGGAAREWAPWRAEAVVPADAIGWRLELRVDASRENLPGGLEIDRVRVIAAPRAVVRWRDPLRRVARDDEDPVAIETIGLPAGDYEVDIAVIDARGAILAAERLPRYVDEGHPIRLQPGAGFLAALRGAGGDGGSPVSAEAAAEIRRIVLVVRGAGGREWIRREEPFAIGEPPFGAGRGRSRHGIEVALAPEPWVESFPPGPVLLVVGADALARVESGVSERLGWPGALAAVPETQRAARVSLGAREPERDRAALAPLFAAVPRWYLAGPSPEMSRSLALLQGAEPDLRFGLADPVPETDPALPRLISIGRTLPADSPRRFAARLDGASLGSDPESWSIALLRLDAAGASEVYLVDPIGSLFIAGPTPEEGYAPRPAWLAWSFARGFLGGARAIARERWLPGVETLLFARGDRGAVAFVAEGAAFRPQTIELGVEAAPRAFDAAGREIALPPVEAGRIAVPLAGRFLLVDGVDLALERTARSLAIRATEGGFSLEVANHLGGRGTIEPSLELPTGYELRGAFEPRTVEAGEIARWSLAIEVPPTAGIEGMETTRGSLALVRPDGRRERVSFERPLPLESSRLEISLADVRAERATVRIANRESAPVSFHLHLQAGPEARGERTFTDERLAAGESRSYELPFAGEPRSGGDLWVGVTFTDGDRGYFNRTFPLP